MISFCCYYTGNATRSNIGGRIYVNGNFVGGTAAMGYLRNNSGHNSAGISASTLAQVNANQLIEIRFARESSPTGAVNLQGDQSCLTVVKISNS